MNMAKELTLEEQATNNETRQHIATVRRFLDLCVVALIQRGELHDASKLVSPEVEAFTQYTPLLAASTYGSPEYDEVRKKLGAALQHHYAKNRHHPEHWANGVLDMNLIDLVEMLCDWKAATLRHNNGNIQKSIEYNAERFGIGHELTRILKNTTDLFE